MEVVDVTLERVWDTLPSPSWTCKTKETVINIYSFCWTLPFVLEIVVDAWSQFSEDFSQVKENLIKRL